MTDIDSALRNVARIRDQLAASTRFQGFAPTIVAATGALAFALALYQAVTMAPDAGIRMSMMQWIVLAVVCATLIGTEALVRARRLHRAMAETMIHTALRQFLPSGMAGAIAGIVILVRAPAQAWMLPGLWQLLLAVGICASLVNLPRQMTWAAGWYFVAGTASLLALSAADTFSPWAMGVPFGVGQLLVALVLHRAAKSASHD